MINHESRWLVSPSSTAITIEFTTSRWRVPPLSTGASFPDRAWESCPVPLLIAGRAKRVLVFPTRRNGTAQPWRGQVAGVVGRQGGVR